MPITEDQVYTAYQAVLDTLNASIISTVDPAAIQILQAHAQNLTDLLDNDDIVRLEANAAELAALSPSMAKVNTLLNTLQNQLKGVADNIADAGKILGAIATALQLTAKFV